MLKKNGISVIIFNDLPVPAKPDAIFPNNWFSTHDDGTIIIYPMMAHSRRHEQRMDIMNYLKDVYRVLLHRTLCVIFTNIVLTFL